MSVPLSAVSMLRIQYAVEGLNHKLDCYMAYNDVLGQHQMVDRDGITTVLWTLGAQYLWDKVRLIFNSTAQASAPSVTLLHRSGSIWNVVDVATLSGHGSLGSTQTPATQTTWTVRDTSFKFIRFEALEAVSLYLGKFPAGLGLGTAFDNISKMLDGTDTDASAPYRWLKSRGDRFIAATGAIAGLSCRPNNRIARARGL